MNSAFVKDKMYLQLQYGACEIHQKINYSAKVLCNQGAHRSVQQCGPLMWFWLWFFRQQCKSAVRLVTQTTLVSRISSLLVLVYWWDLVLSFNGDGNFVCNFFMCDVPKKQRTLTELSLPQNNDFFSSNCHVESLFQDVNESSWDKITLSKRVWVNPSE